MFTLLAMLACIPTSREVGDDDDDDDVEADDTGGYVADAPEGAIVSGDIWCLPPDDISDLDPASLPQGDDPCMEAALYRVASTTDGDTITVEGVESGHWYDVRIIGVDTPETWGGEECYGPEAKEFTYEELGGRYVWLTHDGDCWDDYDRLLAYVHLSDEFDCFFERLLLRGGYAETMTFSATSTYSDTFHDDEDWAEGHSIGMWGECF